MLVTQILDEIQTHRTVLKLALHDLKRIRDSITFTTATLSAFSRGFLQYKDSQRNRDRNCNLKFYMLSLWCNNVYLVL
jgi:hypothetical protein